MTRLNFKKLTLLAKAVVIAGFMVVNMPIIYAEEMEVPIVQQYSIFMKILSCDRMIAERSNGQLVVAIVYQSQYKQSLDTHDEFISIISKNPVSSLDSIPIKYVSIDLNQDTDLVSAFRQADVRVAYIAPLRAYKIENIAFACRQMAVTSLTGVTSYVEAGLAVGISNKGGKPRIIVNLPSAKAEGANFNSQMLKLAKVIK